MTEHPTLQLSDIEIVRGHCTLVSGLSLTLNTPQLLWVEGGNGIGKTSLLRTCAGLSRPSSGTVSWAMNGIASEAPKCVSFLPAMPYAKSGLSVQEEAALWGADLSHVSMIEHAMTRTERLSTGQAKRLSLAKLMTKNKPIWILDEPLAGLDEAGRSFVADCLAKHVSNGGIALVASHAPISVDHVKTRRLSLT